MDKMLVFSKPERCIGCGLCVMRASLIKNSEIGVQNSFIRLYTEKKPYNISIDYGQKNDFKDIVEVCPRDCFEIQ